MRKSTRRSLRDRKRRIENRLRNLDRCDQANPILGAQNVHYEISDRTRGFGAGGIGAMHELARRVGLIDEINGALNLLKVHSPYHESDHVLNMAYNTLAGGRCLEDLERLRNDEVYLDALGSPRIPDPTTAGDFCRRFQPDDVEALMNAINEVRLRVWAKQPASFFEEAVIEADGTLVESTGECKGGMDFSYKGTWSYHPLLVSLANTQEPLFLVNRSGNRNSQEGATARYDQAIELCRRAGFKQITLRGDTAFSQSEHLDRWDDAGVRFVFGYSGTANLVQMADQLAPACWKRLARPARYDVQTEPRSRPENVKEQAVIDREYQNIRLNHEDVASFRYSPSRAKKDHRIVVVRKNLSIERGETVLFEEIRYLFYITNDLETEASEIVYEANARCNQEKLIGQLKGGVHALHAPVDNLVSNWAYSVMASLGWTLKAWFALMLPEKGRWAKKHAAEKATVLRMNFQTFVHAFMLLPTQIVRQGRRTIYRVLGWNRWLHVFFRCWDEIRTPLRC